MTSPKNYHSKHTTKDELRFIKSLDERKLENYIACAPKRAIWDEIDASEIITQARIELRKKVINRVRNKQVS
jgi:hypothetical protein